MDDCKAAVAEFQAALLAYPPLNPAPTFAAPPATSNRTNNSRFYQRGRGAGAGSGVNGGYGLFMESLPTPEIRDMWPDGAAGGSGAAVWVDVIDLYRLFRSVPARTDLLSAVQVTPHTAHLTIEPGCGSYMPLAPCSHTSVCVSTLPAPTNHPFTLDGDADPAQRATLHVAAADVPRHFPPGRHLREWGRGRGGGGVGGAGGKRRVGAGAGQVRYPTKCPFISCACRAHSHTKTLTC